MYADMVYFQPHLSAVKAASVESGWHQVEFTGIWIKMKLEKG